MHFEALTAGERRRVRDAITVQLSNEPTSQTRNRKPMLPNPVAAWQLRVGNFRVYYDVTEEPEQVVLIQTIAVKQREKVYAAGQELQL